MAGFMGLAGPPGLTKLSEQPEKEWRPEARQQGEPPSPCPPPPEVWWPEEGGRGWGRCTVLGGSDTVRGNIEKVQTHLMFECWFVCLIFYQRKKYSGLRNVNLKTCVFRCSKFLLFDTKGLHKFFFVLFSSKFNLMKYFKIIEI